MKLYTLADLVDTDGEAPCAVRLPQAQAAFQAPYKKPQTKLVGSSIDGKAKPNASYVNDLVECSGSI